MVMFYCSGSDNPSSPNHLHPKLTSILNCTVSASSEAGMGRSQVTVWGVESGNGFKNDERRFKRAPILPSLEPYAKSYPHTGLTKKFRLSIYVDD